MSRLTAENIGAFVERDWQRVDESKACYWTERKAGLGPAEGARVADELRRRVAEMLARISFRPR